MSPTPEIPAAVEAVLHLDRSDLCFGISPGEAEKLVRAVLAATEPVRAERRSPDPADR